MIRRIPIRPLPPAPRQLNISFESSLLQGLTPSERANVVALLTNLLLQAAGVLTEDADDEGR